MIIDSTSISLEEEILKSLDSLLVHVAGCDVRMSANEFVNMDENIPVFDQWDNNKEESVIIEDIQNVHDDQGDKEDDMIQEEPPSLVDALEMMRKLHLLTSTRQPELHQLILDLEAKLTDVCIDSKVNKQSSITDFFRKL